MPRAQKNRKQRPWCLVWLVDLHAGSSVAVCPPEYRWHEGGDPHDEKIWQASGPQFWLYECLQDVLKRVKKLARTHRVMVGLGGDLTDGAGHHGTPQTFGDDLAQCDLAVRLLLPFANVADEMFGVRGSRAHGGSMARNDVVVCRELGVRHVAFKELLELDGRLVHAQHHTTASRKAHLRGDAQRRAMRNRYIQALESGERPPDLMLRGHVHLLRHERLPRRRQTPLHSVIGGGWKFGDEYTANFEDELYDLGCALYFPNRNGKGLDHVELVSYVPERTIRRVS